VSLLETAAPAVAPAVGSGRLWRRLRASTAFTAGAVLVVAVVLICAFGPLFLQSPIAQDGSALLAGPSRHHWLGTDQLGRDTLSRLVSGGRTDLHIAVLALITPFVTGLALGTLAGYRGGRIDTVILRVVAVVVAFPFYVLVIALVFAVGAGERGLYAALALVGWVGYARVTRNTTRAVASATWVRAARDGGLSTRRVVLRHVLPHTITPAVILLVSDVVFVMVAVVTLGYLGLGVQPPTPDWGSMIYDSREYLVTAWWLPTLPGLAIVVTGLGFSLLGDGIADVARIKR
jgi:peptide/nickel transport system permease protein